MRQKKRLLSAVLAAVLAASLTGCGGAPAPSGSDSSGDPVRIATKPMTEQYILGEMLGLLIEQAGYEVEITKGVGGGTSNIQPAMESGEFDLYPEYTSSGWVLVLNHQAGGMDDEEMFQQLRQEYEEKFDMTWVGLYGSTTPSPSPSGAMWRSSTGWRTPATWPPWRRADLRRQSGLHRAGGRLRRPVRDLRSGVWECGGHRHRPEVPGPGRRRHRRDQRLHHRRPAGQPGHGSGDPGG